MKKVSKKSLVLSIVSLLAACLLFFVSFVGCADLGIAMSPYWLGVLNSVFLFLSLLCSIVLIVLNLLGFLFSEKVRRVLHVITHISVPLMTAMLFLVAFIAAVTYMVSAFSYVDSAIEVLSALWFILIMLVVNFSPLLLSALLAATYFVLFKKLPKNALIKKVEEFVTEEPAVETQSTESENVD